MQRSAFPVRLRFFPTSYFLSLLWKPVRGRAESLNFSIAPTHTASLRERSTEHGKTAESSTTDGFRLFFLAQSIKQAQSFLQNTRRVVRVRKDWIDWQAGRAFGFYKNAKNVGLDQTEKYWLSGLHLRGVRELRWTR
jgi:hypothetical protein